ncbi:hypothetical protein J6590_019418 [Homalodisca vitripennis]|nr:hypothetical protein J6590_019418 [Homalodisca vitripennis]
MYNGYNKTLEALAGVEWGRKVRKFRKVWTDITMPLSASAVLDSTLRITTVKASSERPLWLIDYTPSVCMSKPGDHCVVTRSMTTDRILSDNGTAEIV